MTVSLPVTLPAPAVAGKAGSAAPGKGVATAPGLKGDAGGPGAEASEVAGMFAALVAALTQQMQPVQTPAQPSAGGEQAADTVTGEPVIGPFVAPAPTVEEVPSGATVVAGGEAAVVVDGEVPQTPVIDDQTALTLDGAEAVDGAGETPEPPGTDTVGEIPLEGEATSDGADGPDVAPVADRPGSARSTGRDERPTPPSGTVPATPAQPAHGNGPATPAVPANPAAKNDADVRPVTGLTTAPTNPAPATPAEAVAAPSAPPVPPADPHLQIARVVRPLRLGTDGAYELALDLTPAELGRVRIDVELRGATIHLSLRADNPATRDLLNASLGQLRTELESAGLQAGNLDIGGQGLGGRDQGDEPQGAAAPLVDEAPAAVTVPTATATAATDAADGVDILA